MRKIIEHKLAGERERLTPRAGPVTIFVMSKPSEVSKHLFRNAPAQVKQLAAQARKEQRDQDRATFKRTEEEAGRWNQQEPKENE
jgi:hypothetical protein